MSSLRTSFLVGLSVITAATLVHAYLSVDELPDLTGGVIPILYPDAGGSYYAGGQLFSGRHLSSRGEVRYIARVKNQSGDPIEADSLVVVVHKIQEMARLRDVTTQLELPDADGETENGKPYFRVPIGGEEELAPYGESEAFTILIENPNLYRLYPPVLRVRGVRRTASQNFQRALQQMSEREGSTPEESE